jgi:hypothetical protein
MSNKLTNYQEMLEDNNYTPTTPNSDNLDRIIKSKELLRLNSSKPINFSSSIISHFGMGAIFPNTINVVQGKKGSHKSRLTEILCMVMLSQMYESEYIGFLRDNSKKYAVLYVDTERNIKEQFPYAIQKIKEKSGYKIEEHPSNFDYISLIDVERSQRLDTLTEYLKITREKYKDCHLFIVMDVITDCIENFNDPRESMKLVDLLNETINNYDVTFLCVIHENPSSGDKARGHLGTEIINKASQVMQIGFEKDSKNNDTELIRLKFLYSRNTKKLDTIFLRYSEALEGLVAVSEEELDDVKHQKQTKASIPEVQVWLKENLHGEIAKKTLISNLREAFDCGERTIEDRLQELLESEFLTKETKGKKVFYQLTIPF